MLKATLAPRNMKKVQLWAGVYGGHYDVIVFFKEKPTNRMDKDDTENNDGTYVNLLHECGDGNIFACVAYDIVTEESAEQGDAAETGWENEAGEPIEPDAYDIDNFGDDAKVMLAVQYLTEHGTVEPSSSQWHQGVWYTQIDSQYGVKHLSFHLKGFTPDEEQAIFDRLKG